MDIDLLSKIKITDEDIDKLEKVWGDVTFDKIRRDIIKDMTSFDVQAFPGTGKTTVLIAKLAIMAKKWPYSTKGICVLSHTNVAREEIEVRLGNTEYGRKLLSYPHFIGTIHSFMDCFVALPWMKSNNYSINVIDSEITLNRRFNKLSKSTREYYFKNNRLDEKACEAADYPIRLNIKCSDTKPSYKDVYKGIENSFKDGYFTFKEILYFARYALKQNLELTEIIKNRFPILFIDEAQDTDNLQEELIGLAFGKNNGAIIQKFGDGNQAIYSSANSEENTTFFPNEPIKTIGNSMRFSNSIAKLSDCFAVCSQGMNGENDAFIKNDAKHTIFLFKKEKLNTIISEYGNLVLECFTDEELEKNLKYGVHIVGMVHNKEPIASNDSHYPSSITDYNKSYIIKASGKSYTPKTMLEYFQLANVSDTTGLFRKINLIADGLRRYINACTLTQIHGSSNVLNSIINSISPDKQMFFRKDFNSIVNLPFRSEDDWRASVDIIKKTIKKYFTTFCENDVFMQWSDNHIAITDTKTKRLNVIEHKNTMGRGVPISFESIHSVKGRTHLSTLVVETFWYEPNIASVLKYICAPNGKPSSRNYKRMKIHYVGLTRAKGLVCLALPIESVNDKQKIQLKEMGWNIQEIT